MRHHNPAAQAEADGWLPATHANEFVMAGGIIIPRYEAMRRAAQCWRALARADTPEGEEARRLGPRGIFDAMRAEAVLPVAHPAASAPAPPPGGS